MSELFHRVATLSGVSFPDRTIELIVIPYETETTVVHDGKLVQEIVSRNAFDGIQQRPNRVRVNRDHDVTRTCGQALRFFPSREEGLVAELRISNTELGNETLQLADEGILDASAGFGLLRDKNGRVKQDAMVWETRGRVRLNHLHLAHVALTPDPAYETANVLAVRQAEAAVEGEPVPTPNLDQVRAWLLQTRYSQLDH